MAGSPVVVVLHGDHRPPSGPMRRIAEHAELRWTDAAGLAEALPGAQILFAYDFTSTALAEAWYAADALEWIHVAAAGVDAFLLEDVREGQVVLTNSRGVFDQAVAEYVLAQILSLAKDLPGAWRRQQRQRWQHRDSERVAGTRALVVGTGPIGRACARLLRAAGLHVEGGGRRERRDDPDFGHVTGPAGLPAALGRADWVVAVAPLTDATRGMFDAAAFAAMADHARLINVGRGELVVTDDLVAALGSGEIAGAALDVVDPEPLPAQHPLWQAPGVVITPHSSGDVTGWQEVLVEVFAANLQAWTAGEPLRNVVDARLGYVPTGA